jgi:hypothetical protein
LRNFTINFLEKLSRLITFAGSLKIKIHEPRK